MNQDCLLSRCFRFFISRHFQPWNHLECNFENIFQCACPDFFPSHSYRITPIISNTLPKKFGSLNIELIINKGSYFVDAWSIKLSIVSMVIVFITFRCRWTKSRWSSSHCRRCSHRCCNFEIVKNEIVKNDYNHQKSNRKLVLMLFNSWIFERCL